MWYSCLNLHSINSFYVTVRTHVNLTSALYIIASVKHCPLRGQFSRLLELQLCMLLTGLMFNNFILCYLIILFDSMLNIQLQLIFIVFYGIHRMQENVYLIIKKNFLPTLLLIHEGGSKPNSFAFVYFIVYCIQLNITNF